MVELDLNLWLQAEDVEPEATLTFTDEGKDTFIPRPEGEADVKAFEISVKLPDGKVKSWTMNLTSQRAVAKTYGTHTPDWIDKQVIVFVTEQNVRGSMRKVIYAKVPSKEPSVTNETVSSPV